MRRLLLSLLKVPERPAPPPGSDETLHVFRSSPEYLRYRFLRWLGKQLGAAVGIAISLLFLGAFGVVSGEERVRELGAELQAAGLPDSILGLSLMQLLGALEVLAVAGFVVQLVVTGLMVKLDWEMRWYMVTDSSLRIREGLSRVREQTMTVANLQDMSIRQGPLQRLLGIADLEVRTAGGGGAVKDDEDGSERKSGLHVGRFRGLRDAEALRNRLRRSLAHHRDAGLGDPDEEAGAIDSDTPDDPDPALVAADRLLDEARRVRVLLEGRR